MVEGIILEDKFNPRELDKISFEKTEDFLPNYIEHNIFLTRLGRGSSRTVYDLEDGNVLKVARDAKGLSQNRAEFELAKTGTSQGKIGGIIATIYDYGAGFSWLRSEKVEPLEHKKEFLRLTGFSFDLLKTALSMNLPFDKFVDWIASIGIPDQMEELQKGKTQVFISSILDAQKAAKLLYGDLANISHWGETVDGRVVLLDYGFTEEVQMAHYVPPSMQEDEPERPFPTTRPYPRWKQ